VNPQTGNSYGLMMPTVNTEVMNLFLNGISKKMSRWKHCILVVDGAGWHDSEELKVPQNITLLKLPPYSPELNCIERLWQWMKNNYLSLKVFPTEDSIYDEGSLAWKNATPEIIKSVCHTSWLSYAN
jgi:transposase